MHVLTSQFYFLAKNIELAVLLLFWSGKYKELKGLVAQPNIALACGYTIRAGARTLIGGGGCIFIYSGYARLISFEINFITKETSRAEPEYMNIHTPN